MRALLAILLVSWLEPSFGDSSRLEKCFSDLRNTHAPSLRRLFPVDDYLIEVRSVETGVSLLAKLPKSKDPSQKYLTDNAIIRCETVRSALQNSSKKFSRFLISLMVTLFSVVVYLFSFALPIRNPKELGRSRRQDQDHGKDQKIGNRMRVLIGFVLVSPSLQAKDTLTVFGYDAFFGKGSLGEVMAKTFKEKFQIEVKNVPFTAEGEALNQIVLKGEKSEADVLVGVDNSLLDRAISTKLFSPLKREWLGESDISAESLDPENRFLPFDHGYLAFVYDTKRSPDLSRIQSFSSLLKETKLKKKVVIQDPRTSSLGLAFLLWTKKVIWEPGLNYDGLWTGLLRQLVTISPGWSGAYGLFLNKEADAVLSYTTSPAYHTEMEKKDHYSYLDFSKNEGHLEQVEYVGVLKKSSHLALAEKYVQLLLSQEIQQLVPTKQWMFPARSQIKLPLSFQTKAKPNKILSATMSEKERTQWVRDWTRLVSQ